MDSILLNYLENISQDEIEIAMKQISIYKDKIDNIDATEFVISIKVPDNLKETAIKFLSIRNNIPNKDITFWYNITYQLDTKKLFIAIDGDSSIEYIDDIPKELDELFRKNFEDYIDNNYEGINTIKCPNCKRKIIDIKNCQTNKVWDNDGNHVLVSLCPYCNASIPHLMTISYNTRKVD